MKDTDTKTLNETFIYEMELLITKVKTRRAKCVLFYSENSAYDGDGDRKIISRFQVNETMPEGKANV
jgi:hypothetical protein